MKMSINKIFFVISFLAINQVCFSQKITDGAYLFKLWFFIERENQDIPKENEFINKDSLLLSLFISAVDIKADTLESKGFSSDYIFLSVAPYKNNQAFSDKSILYIKYNQNIHLGIPVNNCNGYVLCINIRTGRSYRLGGFNGNDLISFMQDVKEDHQIVFSKPLTNKQFFKNYVVENLDFSCMYKGLRSKYVQKYPCLKKCSNYYIVIN